MTTNIGYTKLKGGIIECNFWSNQQEERTLKTIEIRWPDNGHCHLRAGEMMKTVLGFTARSFRRAVVEPNLSLPRVSTVTHVRQYRHEILEACRRQGIKRFKPLMTVRITPQTKPEMIAGFIKARVLAGKLYPEGVTFGSDAALGGVSDFTALYPVFAEMERLDLPLRVHGEMPGVNMLYAEQAFIAVLAEIIIRFSKLRIVVEHVSSAAMLGFIQSARDAGAQIGATITPQHLVLTVADVFANGVVRWPHNYCKPVAKQYSDREALIRFATAGFDWIWAGTDSAPHSKAAKKKDKVAGVWSDPVALPVYTKVFEVADSLKWLNNFLSRNFALFYRLPFNKGTIQLVRQPWPVPDIIGNVVPWMAGEIMDWQVKTA